MDDWQGQGQAQGTPAIAPPPFIVRIAMPQEMYNPAEGRDVFPNLSG